MGYEVKMDFNLPIDEIAAALPDVSDIQSALILAGTAMVKEFLSGVEGAFEGEKSQYGAKWPKLGEKYAKRKEKQFPGRKILVRTGTMKAAVLNPQLSIGGSGGVMHIRLTVDDDLAPKHEFGMDEDNPNLPTRSFWTIDSDRAEQILQVGYDVFGDLIT
jgi:hypothetical protein